MGPGFAVSLFEQGSGALGHGGVAGGRFHLLQRRDELGGELAGIRPLEQLFADIGGSGGGFLFAAGIVQVGLNQFEGGSEWMAPRAASSRFFSSTLPTRRAASRHMARRLSAGTSGSAARRR